MANWSRDDKMVSFIRFTFSTTDDSGLCADVLFDPIKTTKPGSHCSRTVVENTSTDDSQVRFFSTIDASLSEYNTIGLIIAELIFLIRFVYAGSRHRRRSNTLQRLEAMRQQREQNKRIAIVQWQPPTTTKAASSIKKCPFVAVPVNDTRTSPTYSSASAAIKKTQMSNFNPFLDYLKFDESYSPQPSSKKVDVFLPFLDDCELRKVPVHVVMNGNAKVSDLIGLVCYIYTANNWNPPLIQDVNRYALYVAEDTGEVEYGLPARSSSERVNHFHFPFMAIAPRVEECKENTEQLLIHFDCGECITLPVSGSIQCLKTVRDKAVSQYFERCHVPKHKRLNYTLEKFDEPGQSVSLEATLSSVNCHEFFCVRVNSTRKGALVSESNDEDINLFPPFLSSLPSAEYTFDVIVIRPLRISTPSALHVSSCSLTIIPKKLKTKVQLKCIPSFPREAHFLSALRRPVTIPIQKIRFAIRARINESQELMRIEYDNADTLVGQRQKFRLSFAMADMLANVFAQCAVPCRLAPTSTLSRRSRRWKFSLFNRSTFVS
ncbi:Target of rapamycin complex 2 subunit MAPKAP1 [Trichinella nativa]|uniref:Target of rapamycin complex 2 subunit MAPKAP1 n=1 Tax=Trichinella nativa TaxID=6335 RepID=A0A0V1LA28_9BILA|nr:Target of rapamycin complex 2 subunit MAPKAP1 [Trichinella sp. T6]KRZ56355.1 Target of rapamycin complex 2 subunit MAPKAP1 [Trichinella nativa]